MDSLFGYAAPAGRVLLALVFVAGGVQKLFDYAGTAGYMEAYGLPAALMPPVIALELGGGLMVALGWYSRVASLALAGFAVLAAAIFHLDLADQMQTAMLLKNLAIAGVALLELIL